MAALAQIDPSAGAPAGVLIFSIILVGPLAVVLNFLLRRFRLVVAINVATFILFLLGFWLYFELFSPQATGAGGSDLWGFSKLLLLGAVAALVVSCVAGTPLLLARRSGPKPQVPRDRTT